MTRPLQTRMVGYTTDRTGHVMASMEVVYEVEEERAPLWSLYTLHTIAVVAVRSAFAVSPILLAVALLVKAGWLPS